MHGRFRREHESGDRCRVLQRVPRDLGGIDDARFDQVAIPVGLRVVAAVAFRVAHPLGNDRAFLTRVLGDPAQRGLQRTTHDIHAGLLVIVVALEILERRRGTDQGHAAARHDAFLDCRAGRVHGVFHARLLFLHLGLGCRADLDDCNATDELRQSFLQLLAVVVRGGLLDLVAQLLDPSLDRGRGTGTLDDRGVVLVDDHAARLAEIFQLHALELDPGLFHQGPAAGEDRDVLEHGLAPITEARSLHGGDPQRSAQLVHDERGKGFALDILGDDQQGTPLPRDLLEHW